MFGHRAVIHWAHVPGLSFMTVRTASHRDTLSRAVALTGDRNLLRVVANILLTCHTSTQMNWNPAGTQVARVFLGRKWHPLSGFLSLLSLCPGPSQLFRAFQTAENGQDVVVSPVILFFTVKRKTFRVFWCWNKGRRNVIITSPPV